jgi:hypothetical protein
VTDFERLAQTLRDIFAGTAVPKVREVRQVLAVERILRGEPAKVVASDFNLQRRGLEALVARVVTSLAASHLDLSERRAKVFGILLR